MREVRDLFSRRTIRVYKAQNWRNGRCSETIIKSVIISRQRLRIIWLQELLNLLADYVITQGHTRSSQPGGKGGQKLCILRPLRLDTPPFRCPRRLPAFDYSFLHSISFFSSRQPSSSRPLFHFSLLVPSNVVHRKTIAQYKRYNPEFQYRAFSRRQNCAATV